MATSAASSFTFLSDVTATGKATFIDRWDIEHIAKGSKGVL